MTRHERLVDGLGTAQDALGEIASTIRAGRCPHEERVRLCAMQLRTAAAMLEGALTLDDDSLFLTRGGKLPIAAEDAETRRRGDSEDMSTLKREHRAVERLEKLHLW